MSVNNNNKKLVRDKIKVKDRNKNYRSSVSDHNQNRRSNNRDSELAVEKSVPKLSSAKENDALQKAAPQLRKERPKNVTSNSSKSNDQSSSNKEPSPKHTRNNENINSTSSSSQVCLLFSIYFTFK